MKNSTQPPPRSRRSSCSESKDRFPSGRDGFTLVEISVVVMIIGILASMAVSAARKAGDAAKISTYINDIRVFSGAFNQYAQIHGKWPDSQSSAQSFPDGMEGHLSNSSWTRISPIGGSYVWDRNVVQNGSEISAAISLVDTQERPVSASLAQLTEIDHKIDDGNLSTGIFLLGFNDLPTYVIEGTSEPGAAPTPAPPPPTPPTPPSGGGAFGGGFVGSLLLLGIARMLRRKERKS